MAYQNILKLTYIDKFLTEIQLRFRDKYKQVIESAQFDFDFSQFQADFDEILSECEREARAIAASAQKPRTYGESEKSKKTVASMIETKKSGGLFSNLISSVDNSKTGENKVEEKVSNEVNSMDESGLENGEVNASLIESRLKKLAAEKRPQKKFDKSSKGGKNASSPVQVKKGKTARKWEDDVDMKSLNYGDEAPAADQVNINDASDLDKYASVSDFYIKQKPPHFLKFNLNKKKTLENIKES